MGGNLHKQILAMQIYCFINGSSVLNNKFHVLIDNNVRLRASHRLHKDNNCFCNRYPSTTTRKIITQNQRDFKVKQFIQAEERECSPHNRLYRLREIRKSIRGFSFRVVSIQETYSNVETRKNYVVKRYKRKKSKQITFAINDRKIN